MIAIEIPEGSNPYQYLSEMIKGRGLSGGMILGFGGLKWAKIGIFNGRNYDVQLIMAREGHALEVASLIGNYLLPEKGDVSINLYVTLSRDHGEVYSGYLVKAEVKPFLDVFLEEVGSNLFDVFKYRAGKL